MTDFEDYKASSAGNNAAPPAGAPEGQDRDDVNDIMREIMGVTRRDWEGTATGGGEWRDVTKDYAVSYVSDTSFRVAGTDATGFFKAGRKVKLTGGADTYCFVTSSDFVTFDPDTIITVEDFDGIGNAVVHGSANKAHIFNAFGGTPTGGLGKSAFRDTWSPFYIPASADSAGINAAITDAVANNGIVFLEGKSYDIDATIDLVSNLRMMGCGPGITHLTANSSGLNDHMLTGPASSAQDIHLSGFSLNGDEANQTAGRGISFADTLIYSSFTNIQIRDTYDDGIALAGGVGKHYGNVRFEGIDMADPGAHGIVILDSDGSNWDLFLSNIEIFRPGQGGGGTSGDSCIRIEGKFALTNAWLDPGGEGGADQHSALWLEQVDPAGTPAKGGHRSRVSNVAIYNIGTAGTHTFGIVAKGTDCVFSNCVVELAGSNSTPLFVDGRGSGAESAVGNTFSNCIFADGLQVSLSSDALNTQFTGCVFRDQSQYGLRNDGSNTTVTGCTFNASTADAVALALNSDGTVITGCRFIDIGDDGIHASIGSGRAQVYNNYFENIGDDAILVETGTTDMVVWPNEFYGVGGENLLFEGVAYEGTMKDTLVLGVAQHNYGGSPVPVTAMEGISFPVPPNGTRVFEVQCIMSGRTGGNGSSEITYDLKMGPLGTVSDPTISSRAGGSVTSNTQHNLRWGGLAPSFHSPAAAEMVSIRVDEASGDGDADIFGYVVDDSNQATHLRLIYVGEG